MNSMGSGTQLLERDWTFHYSGNAQGVKNLLNPIDTPFTGEAINGNSEEDSATQAESQQGS